ELCATLMPSSSSNTVEQSLCPPVEALVRGRNFCGYDLFWQRPAQTERQAFKMVKANSEELPNGVFYVGFPWATLIDNLRRKRHFARRLRHRLGLIARTVPAGMRVVTVCQHV